MRRSLSTLIVLAFIGAACAFAGCNATPQAQIDRAEVLYGQTVGELNDLYEAGAIPPKTQLNVISPARKEARKALDAAKGALKIGDPGWKILLDTANGILAEIQKYRANPAGSVRAATQPATAGMGDPVSAGLVIAMGLLRIVEQLSPVIGKLLRGEELTPEERAIQEAYSATQTARADANDADAATRV